MGYGGGGAWGRPLHLHPPAESKGGVKRGRSAPVCARRIGHSDNVDYVKFHFLHATYK